ncbi:hypothetical protein SRHO_G00281570 [Serrasalmus rhombeus]
MFSQNLHCLLRSGMRSRREMKTLQLLVLTLLTLTGTCQDRPYVYDSTYPAASGDFKYVGDKTSNCNLLISNVQFSHSGEYRFRWTGDPGVTLKVAVVQVSMIRLSGNGTLKEGDSVNLTCAVNCSLSSPQFVWFKNKERLPESGSVLHLPALTVRNSGNYSCALRNYENFTSEMISLDVEGLFLSSMVSPGLIVVILTLTAVLYWMWSVSKKEDTYTTIIYSTVTTE